MCEEVTGKGSGRGRAGTLPVMDEERVPAELARLWRLSTTSRLGRPAELDVERVVHAAVELADRDGLAGVTLPKIAEVLGVTAMSLYRHVGSKDELHVLMGDAAIGPVPDLDPDTAHWRAGVRQLAYDLHAVYTRHPWRVRLPLTRPPSGPNAVGWLDRFLAALRETGLDWGVKARLVVVVTGFVHSSAQMELEMREGRSGTGLGQAQVERDYGRTMGRLVDPDRFPEAARLFGSAAFESLTEPSAGDPADDDFAFGLEVILDGVASTIAATVATPTTDTTAGSAAE